MKSIKEKAEAYDKVLEWATEAHKVCDGMLKEDLEHLFPELKESDNKRMIQYFKDLAPFDKADELYEKYGFSHKDAIAWLEKQCEHANFRNKIQIGDKVTRNEEGVLVNLSQLNRVAKKQGEQKPAVIIPKFRIGDEIKTSNEESLTITKIDEKGYWSENLFICDFGDADKWELVEQKPIEEVNGEDYGIDGLYAAMDILNKTLGKVEGYQTDDGILEHKCAIIAVKELSKQQKPAWSEEDEKMTKNLTSELYNLEARKLIDKETKDKYTKWLKSLKERYTWKPSNEQMNALNYVVNLMASSERPTENDLYYNILKSLRQQLKKHYL